MEGEGGKSPNKSRCVFYVYRHQKGVTVSTTCTIIGMMRTLVTSVYLTIIIVADSHTKSRVSMIVILCTASTP